MRFSSHSTLCLAPGQRLVEQRAAELSLKHTPSRVSRRRQTALSVVVVRPRLLGVAPRPSRGSIRARGAPAAQASDFQISIGYSYYVLGVLFVVYVFNFIDRQVLAILLEAIKKDLGASDTAMGFLSGFAFALFYTFAGIPIARWADRGSRRSIIALGSRRLERDDRRLRVWRAASCSSPWPRVGVGVGEAAGSPPAHSLISDYFPPERRATALSIYAIGVYVGAMLAYLGGGLIVTHFDWRTAFLVVGLPGIPLALLVRFTVRELPRGLLGRRRGRAPSRFRWARCAVPACSRARSSTSARGASCAALGATGFSRGGRHSSAAYTGWTASRSATGSV